MARSRAYHELVEELSAALGPGARTGSEAATIAASVVHRRLRELRQELAVVTERGDALADAVEGHLFGDLEQVELVMAWLAQRDVLAEDDLAE